MTRPDIIVIGGGIAGTSAAALLAAEAKVMLIEAEPALGYHATGRSAAIFIRNYGNATLRALNAAAEPVLISPDGVSDHSLLSPRGEMLLAGADELDALADYAAGATGMDRLTPDEAVDLVPILRRDHIAGAVIERAARDIDVDRMLQGYARLLRDRGGITITGQAVTGLGQTGQGWQVATQKQIYSTAIVVNAAGAWADQVAQMARLPGIGLIPMRRSAVLLNAPAGYQIDTWPLFGSIMERWYAKPDAGRLMVSPADEDPVDPHDVWPDDMVLAEGLHRFEQAVTIPITRPTHSWAGLRSFAPDRTPVVGFDPRAKGFYWLAGQGGYGVQTAPALAALCAAQCLGRPVAIEPAVEQAINPRRFGEG